MRERETPGRDMTGACPADRAVADDAFIEVEGKAVGYCWPVRVAPRVAELLTPTPEESARGESFESRLGDVLWLAGIALDNMPPHERLARFDVMLGRLTRLVACFDATDGLSIRIIEAEG